MSNFEQRLRASCLLRCRGRRAPVPGVAVPPCATARCCRAAPLQATPALRSRLPARQPRLASAPTRRLPAAAAQLPCALLAPRQACPPARHRHLRPACPTPRWPAATPNSCCCRRRRVGFERCEGVRGRDTELPCGGLGSACGGLGDGEGWPVGRFLAVRPISREGKWARCE